MTPKKKQGEKKTPKRVVDLQFEQLANDFRHPTNRMIQAAAIPLFSFAVLGLVWMIPFPKIAFLAKHGYDTFINWGSFFIAGMIYYYLRLAPTLSYGVLLFIGVFSFFIVQLEYVEWGGGPAVWLVCLILLIVALLALYLGNRLERQETSWRSFRRLLLIGPIWLLHFAFNRFKIPY